MKEKILKDFNDCKHLIVSENDKTMVSMVENIKKSLIQEGADDNFLDIDNLANIIVKWKSTIVLLDKLISDKKSYKNFLEYVYDDIKAGFEYEVLRKCPVSFRFNESSPIQQMELRHFFTNLIFWQGFVEINDKDFKLDERHIFDCANITSNYIEDYLNIHLIIPHKNIVSNKKLNVILHDIIDNAGRIANDFNLIMGITMNVESFIELSKRNKRFKEILMTKIPDDMQPSEIESYLDKLTKEQEKILYDENTCIQPMIRANSGIKEKQRAETFINGGMKPDLNGNTIPMTINTNLIYGGLSNVVYYYIDSLGGKKALLMNKKEMGRSGHFARKVNLSCISIELNESIVDCGTINPILKEIKTKKHLEKLSGLYYRLPHIREYSMLTSDMTELIGKKILVRTPLTCASNDGICLTCYGKLSETNNDVRIGLYSSTKISEPVSQSILSTKHQLNTDSVKIKFNDDFNKFFNIYGNIIVCDIDKELNDKEYSLVIIKENVLMINEFSDKEFNEFVPIFHVRNNTTGELYEFIDLEGKDLFLTETLKDMLLDMGETMEVAFDNITEFSELFALEIENNELTRPLFNLMALMERSEHDGCSTLDEMSQRMLDLLIEGNIPAMGVQGDIMLYPLIRDANDITKRPKFNKFLSRNDYSILTLVMSLKNHESLTISLSSQELMRQIKSPKTFKKTAPSLLDNFYKETL